MKVKITKLNKSEFPEYPTAEKKDYVQGEDNGNISPFIGYWVIGHLIFDITEGRPIQMDREIRNGENVGGYFQTSKVLSYKNGIAKTLNSEYKVEVL